MGKDLTRVRRKRIQRFFRGAHGPGKPSPSWLETGHFIQGVSIVLKRQYEVDGDGNIAETNCGWEPEGTLQPAQTTVKDFRFHLSFFTGKRPTAFLTGDDQLWLFDYTDNGRKGFTDNRLSIVTDPGYESPREAAMAKVIGWIPGFQVYKVKNFQLVGNKMIYDIVEKLYLENEMATGDIIFTGNNE